MGETTLSLPQTGEDEVPGFGFMPDLLAVFPQLAMVDRYDVIVTPVEDHLDYWAFVSVTDNDTQQVFTITHKN